MKVLEAEKHHTDIHEILMDGSPSSQKKKKRNKKIRKKST